MGVEIVLDVHGPDCNPPRDAYYCPTVGEFGSPCHGGFDTCCEFPALHEEIPGNVMAACQQIALMRKAGVRAADEWGATIALLERAGELIRNPQGHNFEWLKRADAFLADLDKLMECDT